MPGILKVIATPIGNLGDISARAQNEFAKADALFAEDTRVTKSLINALGIRLKPDCKVFSCHAQAEKSRIDLMLQKLTQGLSVVLVSDAGSVGISDPGSFLIEEAAKHGFKVEVIPGCCAGVAAIMGSGLDCTRFSFLGFLPQKKAARKKITTESFNAGLSLVIYESANRTKELLEELFETLGKRRVVVARELTKLHETFHRGSLGEPIYPPLVEKGECVVIVEREKKSTAHKLGPSELSNDEMAEFIKAQSADLSTKVAAKLLAEKFSLAKTVAYELVVKSRK